MAPPRVHSVGGSGHRWLVLLARCRVRWCNHPVRVGRAAEVLGGMSQFRRTRPDRQPGLARPRRDPPPEGDQPVSLVEPVNVSRRSVEQLSPVIGADRLARLVGAAGGFRRQLGDRTIWNVSSTATGGGVAEMLHVLLGYVADVGITSRWMVITGDAEFFVITKRLHNQIHGQAAGGPLTSTDVSHYERMLAANAAELLEMIKPG